MENNKGKNSGSQERKYGVTMISRLMGDGLALRGIRWLVEMHSFQISLHGGAHRCLECPMLKPQSGA